MRSIWFDGGRNYSNAGTHWRVCFSFCMYFCLIQNVQSSSQQRVDGLIARAQESN